MVQHHLSIFATAHPISVACAGGEENEHRPNQYEGHVGAAGANTTCLAFICGDELTLETLTELRG